MKYPVEILLGIAGVVAVAQPFLWPIAASGEVETAKPAIVAAQTERVVPKTPVSTSAPAPQPAVVGPPTEPQQPKVAALIGDVWQPERISPAAVTPDQIAVPAQTVSGKAAPEKSRPIRRWARAELERLAAAHARANDVPQTLVHRVIMRESRYQPELIGHGGTIGLMQIKLATARGLGYTGDAQGLRDPDTNLAYGVKYLAGAYRVANGDHDRAVHYYAAGYYDAAKHWRLAHNSSPRPILTRVTPTETAPKQAALEADAQPIVSARPEESVKETATSGDDDKAAAKPKPEIKPAAAVAKPRPKQIAAKPRGLLKLLADAKAEILRPPANIPAGAKAAKPR